MVGRTSYADWFDEPSRNEQVPDGVIPCQRR